MKTTDSSTTKTAAVSKTSQVLRGLLLDRNISPAELSCTLDIPHQKIRELLSNPERSSENTTLLKIAKFFKITIKQLRGHKPLNDDSTTKDDPLDFWSQCADKSPVSKTSIVLKRLLLEHRIRPDELAATLEIPNQEIHQLLYRPEIYPKFSVLMPIATFFKVTIGQLTCDEDLDFRNARYMDSESYILEDELYMQCTQYAIQMFRKYGMVITDEVATKLILDIYRHSVFHNGSTVDENFADWHVSPDE